MPDFPRLLNPLMLHGQLGVPASATGYALVGTPLIRLLHDMLDHAGVLSAATGELASAGADTPAVTAQATAGPTAEVARSGASNPGSHQRHVAEPPASADAFSSTVARVRAELARREQSKKHEDLALDKALAGLTSGTATQSETVVICERGGRSGARIYVSNPTSSAVSVRFRVHAVDAEDVPASFTFDPDILQLAPAALLPIRVAVDLADCVEFAGDLQRRVEFISERECLGVCWLTVRVPNT